MEKESTGGHEVIVEDIYESVLKNAAQSPPRNYLGMSIAGHECDLYLWHYWRQTTPRQTDGRVLLLFELGNHVEKIVCSALRKSGYILQNAYPDPQLSYSDLNGYFCGHPDGIIESDSGNMILEIKSANANKFKQITKEGVKAIYPAYYAQMQLYMHCQGLQRAFFIVMSKNDSSLYSEIVERDETTADRLIKRAKMILTTNSEPAKTVSEYCDYCNYRWHCMNEPGALQTIVTCRSCRYFQMSNNLNPCCNFHNVPLKRLDKACQRWHWLLDRIGG
jgi:CRISPR/Cas system-associated exonuclease Cas4 (RecB family)